MAASVRPRSVVVVLACVIAVVALVAAGAVGWLIRGNGSGSSVASNSVDAGFARDMSVHHTQAITMAGFERDNTSNPAMKVLAYDIETEQEYQVGQMAGWLQVWNVPAQTGATPMIWMGSAHHHLVDGRMPGMATPAELTKLRSLRGKALDVYFLQLMIRHHQGGLPMARYAAAHAKESYVRDFAQAVVNAQSSEIIQMEQTLRQLGGAPLPAPPS
jgi:uncharacterized protein (DUF305 family)